MTLSPSSVSMDELLACDIEVDDLNVELSGGSTPNDTNTEESASKAGSSSSISRSSSRGSSDGSGRCTHVSDGSLVKLDLSKSDASIADAMVNQVQGFEDERVTVLTEGLIMSSCATVSGDGGSQGLVGQGGGQDQDQGHGIITTRTTEPEKLPIRKKHPTKEGVNNKATSAGIGAGIGTAKTKVSSIPIPLPNLDHRTSSAEERQGQQSRLKTWNERFRQTPKAALWQGMWKNKSPLKLAQEHLTANANQNSNTSKDEDADAKESGVLIDGNLVKKVTTKEGKHHETSIPTVTGKQREDPYTSAMGFNIDSSSNPSESEQQQQQHRNSPTNVASRLKRGASSFMFEQRNKAQQSSSSTNPDFFPVKPFHAYPGQFQMSESELYQEMMNPSRQVEELKSRAMVKEKQIGSLKVEVLSCVGLAKFDRFSKPDAIAYLVCGDCAFATDVISSSLSPMWPAGCRRAAVFPLYHAYARLYVGIFNQTEKDSDDFAGRVSINVSSLCPDFEYDANFPLKVSTSVYDRRARGVIRLRFSLHWDSASSAVLSYLPMTVKDAVPWLSDHTKADFVSIPCADTKILKNLISVVHGEDLPGKFSRKAFKASTREMGLYKANLNHAIRIKLNDIMTYRDPIFSMYVFMAWMAMVYTESIALVPSFFVSCIFIIYLKNYHSMRSSLTEATEYQTMSLGDIVYMLLGRPTCSNKKVDVTIGTSSVNCSDLEAYRALVSNSSSDEKDDQEFPFSDGKKYHRTSLGNMMVPSQNQKSQQKATRSSGLYRSISSNDSVNEADGNSSGSGVDENTDVDGSAHQKDTSKRPLGPAQDNDDGEKEGNVFRRNCEGLERRLHNMTGNVLHQYVSRPLASEGKMAPVPIKNIPEPPAKFTNPLAALTASFLEPLMKTIGVYLVIVRAAFNIFAWKDPYFSFWAMIFLGILVFVLAIFPWRLFFFVSGLICFGPQNYILKSVMCAKRNRLKHEKDEGKEIATQTTASSERQKIGFGKKRVDGNESSKPVIRDAYIFAGGKGFDVGKSPEDDIHEVIVPYQRLATERFYFWPPQPLPSMDTKKDDIEETVSKKMS